MNKSSKIIIVMLCSALLFVGLLPSAVAAPLEVSWPLTGRFGSNHTFTLTRDGTMTISGNGPMVGDQEYEFPWYVSIGEQLYDFSNHVVRVTVTTGTTSVGESAFSRFYNLREVSLPQGIKTIDADAFTGCKVLEKINLPKELTKIGDNAFAGCQQLKDISLPSTLKSLS